MPETVQCSSFLWNQYYLYTGNLAAVVRCCGEVMWLGDVVWCCVESNCGEMMW